MTSLRIYTTRCVLWRTPTQHSFSASQFPKISSRWLTSSVHLRNQNNASQVHARWACKISPAPLPAGTRHFSVNQNEEELKRPTRAIQLSNLVDGLLESPTHPTGDEWLKVGDTIASLLPNSKQWPSVLMKIFAGKYKDCEQQSSKRIALAKSLLEFTRHIDDGCTDRVRSRVTVALLTSYMSICGEHLNFSPTQNREIEAHIATTFDEVKQKAPVYDFDSSVAVIKALCPTKELWRQGLDVLDTVKDVYQPSEGHLTPLIVAAYREDCSEVVQGLLTELARCLPGTNCFAPVLDDRVVGAALDKARRDGHPGAMLHLLRHMQQHRWLLNSTVTTQLINYYKSIPNEQWTGSTTTVTANGVCNNCGRHLESEDLTPQQFADLRDSFLQRCIHREDIFLNTSPQELRMFQKFLKERPPFDMVLDGLNIAMMTISKKPYHQASNLLDVVQDFSKMGRLLVCGRKHMQNWPHHLMTRVRRLATVFLAENVSSDDPFMLYAALHSGPQTLIVSRDMLRDHRYLLPSLHQHNFNTWQRTHQVTLNRRTNHRPSYHWPSQHDTRVQWRAEGCHVPFEDQLVRPSHEQPTSWVCLKKGCK